MLEVSILTLSESKIWKSGYQNIGARKLGYCQYTIEVWILLLEVRILLIIVDSGAEPLTKGYFE